VCVCVLHCTKCKIFCCGPRVVEQERCAPIILPEYCAFGNRATIIHPWRTGAVVRSAATSRSPKRVRSRSLLYIHIILRLFVFCGNVITWSLHHKLSAPLSLQTSCFAMASTNRDALLALYHATGGPSWRRRRNWDTEASISTWSEVEVTDQGHAMKLCLTANNLRGILTYLAMAILAFSENANAWEPSSDRTWRSLCLNSRKDLLSPGSRFGPQLACLAEGSQ